LTDYWTDFESESAFEKVLSLATILVQVFIDQSYRFTLQGPIRTKSPSPDNWAYNPPGPTIGPILKLKNGFEKIAAGYNTNAGFYRPKLFVNPSRPSQHEHVVLTLQTGDSSLVSF
jgi:hypothetical protein